MDTTGSSVHGTGGVHMCGGFDAGGAPGIQMCEGVAMREGAEGGGGEPGIGMATFSEGTSLIPSPLMFVTELSLRTGRFGVVGGERILPLRSGDVLLLPLVGVVDRLGVLLGLRKTCPPKETIRMRVFDALW